MVMEALPSPQSVGREFVRQYYTLLHKAPSHLHRFYNQQSSFIHGGLDPPNRETSPVIGQKQIHQKIQQLNFRDCHAKITQVDSQSTLGNGVVVQVTGELSNAGQPMRRFTQTFVLAAQSPKKYYVHNDIFRYQDEIITDEECDADNESEHEEEVVQKDRPTMDTMQQPLTQPAAGIPPYYNAPTAVAPAPVQPTMPQQMAAQQPPHQQQPTAPPPPHVLAAAAVQQQQPPTVPAVNGHPEEIGGYQAQVPHVPAVQPQNLGGAMPNIQQGLVQPPLNQQPSAPIEEPQQAVEEHMEEPEPAYNEPEPEPEMEGASEPASNEPRTYANLLKSGNTVGTSVPFGASGPGQMGSAVPQQQQYGHPQSPPPQQSGFGAPRSGPGGRPMGPPRGQPGQQGGRPQQGRQEMGNRSSTAPRNFMDNDDRRRSQSTNNDANQLFLGNLPHNATEDEIREIFVEFGTIVDFRMYSKQAKSLPPGSRQPPNYGFITFESYQDIQRVLQAKPIFYPKDDMSGTQLNVEEKKKDRPPYSGGGSGGGRPSMDGNRNRGGGDTGGPRRGMGGPGGPNRGGQGGPAGPNRTNTYNRSGGPPNRGGQQNSYNRR